MSTAVATKKAEPVAQERALATVEDVSKALQRPDRREALMALLGDAVPIERFEQIVIQSVYRNPDLQRASLASLLNAVRVAATSRLEPTGILGEGYLIRYGNDAQFEYGYRGLMKLARRSGQIAAIDSQIVYENDLFDVDLGSEPKIVHKPVLEGERGNYRGAYAWARLTSGELIVDWMSFADIEAVRKISRNGTGANSPWVNHWGEMARKTTLKRLMKRLPLGLDAEGALVEEARADEAARPQSATVTRIHKRLGVAPTNDEPDGSAAASLTADQDHGEAPAVAGGEAQEVESAGLPADDLSADEQVFEGEYESVKDEVPADVQAGLDLLPKDHRKGKHL